VVLVEKDSMDALVELRGRVVCADGDADPEHEDRTSAITASPASRHIIIFE
jgi:hypothetical protein